MTQGENLSSKVFGKVSQLVKQYHALTLEVEEQKTEISERNQQIETLNGQVLELKEEVKHCN